MYHSSHTVTRGGPPHTLLVQIVIRIRVQTGLLACQIFSRPSGRFCFIIVWVVSLRICLSVRCCCIMAQGLNRSSLFSVWGLRTYDRGELLFVRLGSRYTKACFDSIGKGPRPSNQQLKAYVHRKLSAITAPRSAISAVAQLLLKIHINTTMKRNANATD